MASRRGELGIDEGNVLAPDRDDRTVAARSSKERSMGGVFRVLDASARLTK